MKLAPPLPALAAPLLASGLAAPLASLASSLTWAYGSAIYARQAREAGAIEVNLTRTLLVLPLFWGTAALGGGLTGANLAVLTQPERLGWLLLSTLCSYVFGDVCFYLAAARMPTATALAIASTYPVWAAVAGALTLGESLRLGRLAGILLCVVGVMWLVMQQQPSGQAARSGGRRAVVEGVALSLVTSLLWAGNTYAIRRGAGALPGALVNSVRYSFSLLFLLPMWLQRQRREGPRRPEQRLLYPGRRLLGFSVTAFIEAYGGSTVFVYGLANCDLSVAAPLSSLAPLFAVPVGIVLGSESLDLRRFAAIVLTVAGVVLLVR